MKFFIYFCCIESYTLEPWDPSAHGIFKEISKRLVDTSRDPRAGFFTLAIQRGNAASLLAHLLTKLSARYSLTTPMPSALRSNVDEAGQDSNIAKMIDFINSVYNDDDRSAARSGRYDLKLRRFQLPVLRGIIDISPSAVVPNDEDMENQLEKLQDTARYHVIDNPEVLEVYHNKQKLKNIASLLNPAAPVAAVSETSTVGNKLRYYNFKSNSIASTKSTEINAFNQSHHTPIPNPLDGLQELTTVERTYRPSFPDDDDDGDKFVTEDIEMTVTEKENNTPRVKAKNHGGTIEKQPEINNTVKIENYRTLDIKALDKGYQARIEEEKAQVDTTKEIGQIKQELPLKTEKNNDAVIINEEKSGSYKEYITTKLDHNSNEKLSEGSVRRRDEYYKNDGNKMINGTTDTDSEKDKKLKERSWDTNIVTNVPVETLMGRIDKSALITKQNNNRDHKEQHSIYAHKERKVNSSKHLKNRHEKGDKYGSKKKDKIDDGWSKKEKDWNKIDRQRYNKDIEYDRMEHEWNKRHQQYDENDNLDMNDNQWDKNDDLNSRDYDSNNRDDDWVKRDNDWNDRDIDLKKRDSDLNKRDIDLNKRDDDWNKRDFDSNKRNNDWNKRDNGWIKQESKPYKDDRNKNDGDRKQNEWDNKYSEMNNENDRNKHDRYEIVDRKRKDVEFNQHSEV